MKSIQQQQDSQIGNNDAKQCCQKEPCVHKITIRHIPQGFFNRQNSQAQEYIFESQQEETLKKNYCTLPKFTPNGQPYFPCFQSECDQQINLTRSSHLLTEYIKKKNQSRDKQVPLKAPKPLKKRTKCHICFRDFSEEGYFEHIESEEHKYNYYNNKYYSSIITLEKQFKKDFQDNSNVSFSDSSSKESKIEKSISSSLIHNNLTSEENQENALQFSDWNLGDSFAAPIGSEFDNYKSEGASKLQCDQGNQNGSNESDDESSRKQRESFVDKAIDFISNMIPTSFGEILRTQKHSNCSTFLYDTRKKSKKRTFSQVVASSSAVRASNNQNIFINKSINYHMIDEQNVTPNYQNTHLDYVLTKQLKLHNSQSDSYQLQIHNKSTTCTSQKEPLIQNKIQTPSSQSLWDKVKKVFFSMIKND